MFAYLYTVVIAGIVLQIMQVSILDIQYYKLPVIANFILVPTRTTSFTEASQIQMSLE